MTPIEKAHYAAGSLADFVPKEGELPGSHYFEFSGWEGYSGGCHSFRGNTAREGTDDATLSLDIDGLMVEDVERIFRVLRLGKAADRALDEALALAAE